MPSYKIFLTKSAEAARAIAKGFSMNISGRIDGVKSVSYGYVEGCEAIPKMYHDKKYFYCTVELENLDGTAAKCEIIIC